MDDRFKMEIKLNNTITNMSKKLGVKYKIIRMYGGFKIFTIDNEPIARVDVFNKKFELFDYFNNLPRNLRRSLIEDLRYATLFDDTERRFA